MTIPVRGLGSAWEGEPPDLRGCWAKYDRAWEQLQSLREEADRRPWSVGFRPVTRQALSAHTADAMEFVCTHVDAPPIRWAAIVGEIVHDLRSALDHLACQMTLAEGGDCEEPRSQFPIVTNGPDFAGVAGRFISQVDARTRAIFEALQPYHALDWPQRDGVLVYRHPLSLLNRISNHDKHRLPALAVYGPSEIKLEDDLGLSHARHAGLTYRRAPFRVGEVAFTIHIVPTEPSPSITHGPTVHPTVAFEDGEPLFDSLECAAYFVAGLLREFEPDPVAAPQRQDQ